MVTLMNENYFLEQIHTNEQHYRTELVENLKKGKSILITGVPLPYCSRFSINLICGWQEGEGVDTDVALHLNPRIQQRYLVRNSRINGYWGQEETTLSTEFPFRPNKKFNLIIFVEDEKFYLSINGKHCCTYNYRISLMKINAIEIVGSVNISALEYKDLNAYPYEEELKDVFTTLLGASSPPDKAMDMPVTVRLPKGLQLGWQLEINGRVKILPHSFYVNLQEGWHQWPHPIIPLHLNPRFVTLSYGGEYVFVRNAWIDDGGWGQEERAPSFQFSPGSPFTLTIRRGSEYFSVWVNGKLIGEFAFRKIPDAINTVHIQGDVFIYSIYLNEIKNSLSTITTIYN